MLSKEEKRERNSAFWTDFKIYMSRQKSITGKKISWLNYPTDIKYVFVRLETDRYGARVLFDIQAKDPGIREIMWEQMEELKQVMNSFMGDSGVWYAEYSTPQIDALCRIKWEITDVNYFVEADKERIFAFFKERLIAFDAFYQEFKDILINLAK